MEEISRPKSGFWAAAKRTMLLWITLLIIGFALGFYFGYDIGFEKAVNILK